MACDRLIAFTVLSATASDCSTSVCFVVLELQLTPLSRKRANDSIIYTQLSRVRNCEKALNSRPETLERRDQPIVRPYAEAHRAQVPSEDALPDKDVLEALLKEWWSLVKEVSMTRIEAATILNEEEVGDASQQKPQLKEDSPPKSDNDILQLNCFGTKLRHVHLREELINITKLHYLRSCLSGPALKAIEGLRGESWIFPQLSLVGLKSYTHDGAAQLTRLHNELNRHFIQLNAHGKNVISGLNGHFCLHSLFTHFCS
ncbi:hypothetical protein T01_7129 [Trichinella spiralis]|uniref:Uncharacterized protein n=1 Tax=Trichinella spiralis TaxID=6334 RepID=A0A0V1AQ70_TRISP|nr:hypothetical protein T01_7129 [Trichinella spiralis]